MDVGFDYKKTALEEVVCNLCGSDDFFVLARKAASGLPVRTCLCRQCGLIYINPRMTKAGYDDYYKYFYRADRSSVKSEKRPADELEINFAASRKFGLALARKFKDCINKEGLTLDVGSSTGGVLSALKEVFPDIELLGVEPSVLESEFANRQGVKTEAGLFEDLAGRKILPEQGYANILCLRTLNHLLDPKGFFRRAFERLNPGGYLILEVKNFRHQARRAGSVVAGVQIDHPYMFTPETLKLFVEAVGFRIAFFESDEYESKAAAVRQREEGLSVHHLRLSAEKPSRATRCFYEAKLNPEIPRILKSQLSPLALKAYYLIYYHRRLGAARRLLGLTARN